MANNCDNYIVIDGVKKEDFPKIQEFFGDYHNHNYLSDWVKASFLNEHLDVLELTEEEKNDPYKVSGSKWFDFDVVYEEKGNYLYINGGSAWSPMDRLTRLLSKALDADAEIEYSEGGCDFAGKAKYTSGRVVYEVSWKYFEGLYHLDEDMFINELDFKAGNLLEEEKLTEEEFVEKMMEECSFVDFSEHSELKDDLVEIYKEKSELLKGRV